MNSRLLIYVFLLLFSIRGYGQCPLSVSISQSEPTICSGNSIILTAVTTGGTPSSYVWSTGGGTNSITVNKAGTYSVTVIKPGCPTLKAQINVTASTTPNEPTVANANNVCPNTSVTLHATAPGGTYQWYNSSGTFLVTDSIYTTPVLTANAVFFVQTTIGGCTSSRAQVNVYLTGKPSVTGATVCAGSVATLLVNSGDSFAWYSTPNGGTPLATTASFTTPVLFATTTYYVVVTSNGCTSSPTPVTATVTQPPQPPTIEPVPVVCAGNNVNLHADTTLGVIFNWYNVPSGGTPLISSPDYTTPVLNATTTYYVESEVNDCVSSRKAVTVTVTQNPAAPAPQTQTICYHSSAMLTGGTNTSLTYKWYDAASGGDLLYTGRIYTTPVLAQTTIYYVSLVNGSCESGRSAVTVKVSPMVTAPSVPGVIICPGNMATLTATPQNGNFQWYDAPTGGNLVSQANPFITLALTANTTYYVQNTVGNCSSPRTAVTVTILAAPAPPAVSNTSVCYNSQAVLTATSPGGNYAWYATATGGSPLSTAQVYTTPYLTANTNYYVETTNANGCPSLRALLAVTVNAEPPAPMVSGTASVCSGSQAALTASVPNGGQPQWYDTATGGTMLATGANYTTPALNVTTTYYAQDVIAGCAGPRTPFTVNVTPVIDPQFLYAGATYCTSSPNPTPTILNPAGGTFSATPAGLVFVSTVTGVVNIGASSAGTYVISFTGNDQCHHVTTLNFSIVVLADAKFTYAGPYCQDGTDPFPQFLSGETAGLFTAAPAGLVFVNAITGEINLSKSSPGSYTVTNTISPMGGCANSTATASVTIAARVNVDAGQPQTVETGTTVQLNGTISGGVKTGSWSGGSGFFINGSSVKAMYTPGPGETVAHLTLTSDDPAAPCGPHSGMVTINFLPAPPYPAVQGISICDGTNTTLSATAPGGHYQWFATKTGDQVLDTGRNFTTALLTQTTTYYVQTTINGLVSPRAAVTVTVNPLPVAPTVTAPLTCSGNAAVITAHGSSGTYQWYDAPAGGNLLSTDSTYVTPILLGNTSYYVESITNNCESARTEVDIPVTIVPNITSASTSAVCSGNPLNYAILSDGGIVAYKWSRAAVTGISNPAVSNQTSHSITETLVNTTPAAIDVTYLIAPLSGQCSGPVFSYIVTVNPQPVVTGPDTATICNGTSDNYPILFNTPVNKYNWSRNTVNGISNAAVSGQESAIIREVLFNTTTAPIVVPYVINDQTNTCDGTPSALNITVNPTALVTSALTGVICSGIAQNYAITSNIPSATYSWSRDAVNDISNAAASNQTSDIINETLVNTGTSQVKVLYIITPQAYGCSGTPFNYFVTVDPALKAPVPNSNSPVCTGTTIQLRTASVQSGTYLWTGPNGFSSTLQNPNIDNATAANSGIYKLVVTNKYGCPGPDSTVAVAVNAPGIAVAGPSQKVCVTIPFIALNGAITGGPATGIWSTAGTGTFSISDTVITEYFPSKADRDAGSVVLTLSSASPDNCAISTSSLTITFGPVAGVSAGPDQVACVQTTAVKLAGTLLTPVNVQWSTLGSGTFSSDTELDPVYMPSAADEKNGEVILILSVVNGGPCYIQSDTMVIKFSGPPKLNSGGIVYVVKGHTATLNPVVNESDLTYLWAPDIDINNINVKNPIITGDIDRFYTLTVTDTLGCQTTDSTYIKVSPIIILPNTFTPNGDGINDTWEIKGLVAYTQATVDIFNRYGIKLYHSVGYTKPWDGTYNGSPLPSGAYYYIIDTKVNNQVLSGSVDIIR